MLDLELDRDWLEATTPAVEQVLQRMRAQGRAQLLQRGRWLIATEDGPDGAPVRARVDYLEQVAAAVLRRLDIDYYVSWHSALWHYGLIDQQSRQVYVATTKRKRPVQMGRMGVRFVTVADRKFFGGVQVELEEPVWMATPEKALIDSLDRPQLAAPVPVVADALKRAWQDNLIDATRLVDYAHRFDSPGLNRRLGFWMDLFEIPGSEPLSWHLGRSSPMALAPGHRPTGGQRHPVNKRWLVYEHPTIIGAALELK